MKTQIARQRHRRASEHVRKAAQRTLAEAGSRGDVARAIRRDRSTISHEVTSRCHPILQEAYGLCLELTVGEGVSARAFAEAVAEVVEVREIVEAETETLVARGLHLMELENTTCRDEQIAALVGDTEHEVALRKHGSVCNELALIIAELRERRVSLHARYRENWEATS